MSAAEKIQIREDNSSSAQDKVLCDMYVVYSELCYLEDSFGFDLKLS